MITRITICGISGETYDHTTSKWFLIDDEYQPYCLWDEDLPNRTLTRHNGNLLDLETLISNNISDEQ